MDDGLRKPDYYVFIIASANTNTQNYASGVPMQLRRSLAAILLVIGGCNSSVTDVPRQMYKLHTLDAHALPHIVRTDTATDGVFIHRVVESGHFMSERGAYSITIMAFDSANVSANRSPPYSVFGEAGRLLLSADTLLLTAYDGSARIGLVSDGEVQLTLPVLGRSVVLTFSR